MDEERSAQQPPPDALKEPEAVPDGERPTEDAPGAEAAADREEAAQQTDRGT